MISLIQELQDRTAKGDADAGSFGAKHDAMRIYLERNYYPYIQANCPWFTDHGKAHIDGVLWASGQILEKVISSSSILTSFDIYLLITAIIWHDAGMVAKRQGHEQVVLKFLDEIATIAFNDIKEKRLVSEIIGAHTGKATFSGLRQEERIDKYVVYPRALAALLRFADEVSENSTRISQPLLNNGTVPSDHQIFWYYAASVKASHPEPARERVVLNIELDRKEAIKLFDLPQGGEKTPLKLSLIDYVMQRIEKIVCERAYCAPQFLRYASIQSIEVRLCLLDGASRLQGYEEVLEFSGSEDYPAISVSQKFFDEHPKWKVEQLARTIQG